MGSSSQELTGRLSADGFRSPPTGHTPGPWTCDESEIFAGDVLLAETVPPPGDLGIRPYSPEEIANARLIAASPTMYAYVANAAATGCPIAQGIVESIKATLPQPARGGNASFAERLTPNTPTPDQTGGK